MGHRERKKARTKQLLTETALRLFVERGYDETKIDDITAAADVVQRTFFRYFTSKDDVLFSWYESISCGGVEALKARPKGEGVVSALAAALLESSRLISVLHPVVVVTRQVMQKSPGIQARWDALRANYQRDIASTLSSRLPASGALLADMITAAVLQAFVAAIDRWAADGGKRPQNDYTLPALRRALKLFESIDKDYVLR